jgi:hypothetical protein
MRVLWIISGLLTWLVAAPAAADDDLVSVFKSICMTSGPFREAVREFSQTRNLNVTLIPSEPASLSSSSLPPIEPQIVRGAEIMPRLIIAEAHSFGGPAGSAAPSYAIKVSIGRLAVGQVFDSCAVSQEGLTLDRLGARVETALELPASHPLSAEIGKALDDIPVYASARHWRLSFEGWDHVVAYERTNGRSGISLARLRSTQ